MQSEYLVGGWDICMYCMYSISLPFNYNHNPFGTFNILFFFPVQVFLVRKIVGVDAGKLFAMKVLRKASLKGLHHAVFVVLMIQMFCQQLGTE